MLAESGATSSRGSRAPLAHATKENASSSHSVDNNNHLSVDTADDDTWLDAQEEQAAAQTLSSPCDRIETKNQPSPDAPQIVAAHNSSGIDDSSQCDDLILHKAVFNNDADKIYTILSQDKDLAKELVNKKDKHGNTPLHLACMLGLSAPIVRALLDAGASIDVKNLNRWTPFHEACSYGNRDIVTMLTKRLDEVIHESLNKHKLSEMLEKTRNYRIVLRWEFQSWVPFLSRVLPSDVCVITKYGKNIRIDTHLLGFERLSWKKGNRCLIYSKNFEKKWIILNSKSKKYQHLARGAFARDIEAKVDEVMSTDIIDFEIKSNDIQFTRSTCGWIWKADKMEKVGRYHSALYECNNVLLVTRKRREHLSEEDLKRNKLVYNNAVNIWKFGKQNPQTEAEESDLSDSDASSLSTEEAEVSHRESVPAPPPNEVTWLQYCHAPAGRHPTLGREHRYKETKNSFKASIAMSEEFPLSKHEFLDLISAVPLKLFKKLKSFIEIVLPEGFPVRLDIPVFPLLSARITFEDFNYIEGSIDESLFTIPADYVEDSNWTPTL